MQVSAPSTAGCQARKSGELVLKASKLPDGFQESIFFFFLMIYLFIYLFIYFWLCWVFVAAHRLSLVAARGALFMALSGLLIAVASLAAEHGL